jgi:histidine triad (HIT) family protein
MSKTIFSRIIQWEIPSYKIYENPYVFTFLDIHPIQPGHVLVVPKVEVNHFDELTEPFYSEVFKVAQMIAKAQKKAFQTDRITLQIHGFEVPHAHVHLIPANSMQDALITFVPTADGEVLEEIKNRILSHLI